MYVLVYVAQRGVSSSNKHSENEKQNFHKIVKTVRLGIFFFVGQKDELIDFVFISNNPEGIAIKIYCDISFAISNFATESPMSKTTTNFSRRTHSLTHNYNWLSSNNRKIIDKVKHINLEMMQLHAHTPFVICVCTLQPAQNNGPNALAQF